MNQESILFNSKSVSYSFLSNFAEFSFIVNDVAFQSSEHFYQWSKFHESEVEHRNNILIAPTPGDAKRLGKAKSKKIQRDWNDKRIMVMATAIYNKFGQNEILKKMLLDTGDTTLVEDAWWDSFWGNGKDSNGKNMMGQLLMQYRDFLRREMSEEVVTNE